jgi:hypothetical protein
MSDPTFFLNLPQPPTLLDFEEAERNALFKGRTMFGEIFIVTLRLTTPTERSLLRKVEVDYSISTK